MYLVRDRDADGTLDGDTLKLIPPFVAYLLLALQTV